MKRSTSAPNTQLPTAAGSAVRRAGGRGEGVDQSMAEEKVSINSKGVGVGGVGSRDKKGAKEKDGGGVGGQRRGSLEGGGVKGERGRGSVSPVRGGRVVVTEAEAVRVAERKAKENSAKEKEKEKAVESERVRGEWCISERKK